MATTSADILRIHLPFESDAASRLRERQMAYAIDTGRLVMKLVGGALQYWSPSSNIGGTTNTIPKFTALGFTNSIISEDSGAITIDGSLVVDGSTGITGDLDVQGNATLNGATFLGGSIHMSNPVFVDNSLNVSGLGSFHAGIKLNGNVGGGTPGMIYGQQDSGTVIYSRSGTSSDFLLANGVGSSVMTVLPGTTRVVFYGPVSAASTIAIGNNALRVASNGRTILNTASDHGETFQVDGTVWLNGHTLLGTSLNVSGTGTINTIQSTTLNVTNLATFSSSVDLASGRNSFQSGSSNPSLYRSLDTGTSPFTSNGHFIIQGRSDQTRSIMFVTGTSPAVRYEIDGNGMHSFNGAVIMSSSLNVSGFSTLRSGLLINGSTAVGSGIGAYFNYTSGDGGILTLSGPSLALVDIDSNLNAAAATVDSLTFTAGNTALDYYGEGTASLTMTGLTTTVTSAARYVRVGKMVTLYFPDMTGTSNSTSLTLTGLPASLQPTRNQFVVFESAVDNGNPYLGSMAIQPSTGVINIYRRTSLTTLPSEVFTSSGTKGIYSNTVSYSLV